MKRFAYILSRLTRKHLVYAGIALLALLAIFIGIMGYGMKTMTLELKTSSKGMGQIFFRTDEQWYQESQSYYFPIFQETTFHKYVIPLPARLVALRIDPIASLGRFEIKSITIYDGITTYHWTHAQLVRAVIPLHRVRIDQQSQTTLIGESDGVDPYVEMAIPAAYNALSLMRGIKVLLLFLGVLIGIRGVWFVHQKFADRWRACWIFGKPEWLFAGLAILFGTCLIAATPPFQVPDEDAHFMRAFMISELHFDCKRSPQNPQGMKGDFIPKSLKTFEAEFLPRIPFHPEEKIRIRQFGALFLAGFDPEQRQFVPIRTCANIPGAYIPQAVGIKIGTILHTPPIMLMYLGRLFNLLFWIWLVYHAIRICPVYKYLLLLLALTPMSLFISASLSIDGGLNGLILLYIALILKFALGDQNSIPLQALFLLMLMALWFALYKIVYGPVALLILLIPGRAFGALKRYRFYVVALMVGICIAIVVGSMATGLKHSVLQVRLTQPHWNLIFSHPFDHIARIVHTLYALKTSYIATLIGYLGWLDAPLPEWLTLGYWGLLWVIACIEHDARFHVSVPQKLIAFGIFSIILAAIFTIMYVAETPLYSPIIFKVQGRYFTSVIFLLFFLCYNHFMRFPRFLKFGIVVFLIYCQYVTIVTLLERYYIFPMV